MRTVVSAKEIVAAVAEAEERIRVNPDSFPLFASLLPDVNMLMVEQAEATLSRSEAPMEEALRAQGREKNKCGHWPPSSRSLSLMLLRVTRR